MQDFSLLLVERSPTIVSRWVDAVARSQKIESANGLSRSAIRDHIDHVLAAMVTVLSQHQDNDVNQIISASLCHGKLRSEQGFDPDEIAQEYRLLRATIRETIQAELMQGTAKEAIRAVAMIDEVVDAAISYCFQSYHTQQVETLTQIQHQLNLTINELMRLVQASQTDLATLAHELKSPLAAIMSYAELFLRQQRMQAQNATLNYDAIQRIVQASQRLLHLINSTLELSRTTCEQVSLHLSEVSVAELLESVIEIMQPLASDRGLELSLTLEDAPKTAVVTDFTKLQQVLINLISNAVQYTQQGKIHLNCWRISSREWAISVIDTGIGIAPENQSQIFAPFVRTQTDKDESALIRSGLGLAIVDRLVTLLQGRIYVASELGEGATFTVIFPLQLQSPNSSA